MLGFLIGLGLDELQCLIYLKILTWFDILVFFTNSMKVQFWYLSTFHHFSVTDGFDWFIYDFLGGVICNIVTYADDTNPYSDFRDQSLL